ncbi:MAG: AAA family ATPase [Akkermansiaceae bacterium]
MRIQHVTPILVKRYMNPNTRKRTVFLRGPSGIGKSEVVFQTSELLADHIPDWRGVVDLRLAQMVPTDLRGVPTVVEGRTTWARPDFLPSEGAGILFLDEITSAPPAIQAAAYQLTLSPQDFGIPDTWMVIAAGNRKTDRVVTFNLAAPLQNRMCDIDVSTTLDDFTNHAIKYVRPEILSFLRDRPDLLHKFEPTGDIKPFPSPRSWFAVSHTLDCDFPVQDRVEQIKGDIGEEAAMVFETHLRVWETMPRIDDILEGRDVPVPKELNVRYCVAMGLATRLTGDNFDNAWNFLSQMPADVQTLTIKLAYKRDKSLTRSAAYTKWAVANQAAFSRS